MQGIKHRGVKVLKGAGQLQQLGRVGLQLSRGNPGNLHDMKRVATVYSGEGSARYKTQRS